MTHKTHIEPSEAIEARRKAIRDQMAALQEEDAELQTALNVIHRLSPDSKKTESKGGGNGTPRPEGLPNTFGMVQGVLKDAEMNGKPGLTARQIVDAIGSRYWPGVADNNIQPSLYGFAKSKRLRKRGTKFHRVEKNEAPPDEPGSAPKVTGEADTSLFERLSSELESG